MFHESTESLRPVVSACRVAADLSPGGQVEEHREQTSAFWGREDNHGCQMSYNASIFVVHFRSSGTFESLYTSLTVNQLTSTCPPKRVTGNDFILHKALGKGQVTLSSS